MANAIGWNPLRSGRAAALWGAGVAAATVGGVLWGRRAQRRTWSQGAALEGFDKDRLAETLSGLIATCVDGQHGFETAAEAIRDRQIQSLFRRYSRQRRDFRLELELITRRIGRQPRTSGSVAGAAHQTWMDIKSLATRGDESAILAEAERGEDTAVQAYEQALQAGVPANIEGVLRRQLNDIKSVHDRVRSLRDSYARTH